MEIVNRSFTPAEFAAYVEALELPLQPWRAQFCVLHNTAPPTLAERPHGFSAQNMEDMAAFYADKGWHAGPHLFVDDTARGIHVFTPLDVPGVHSPSWNHVAYGIEQLGDYDTDDYNSGRGARVKANTIAALAVLCRCAQIDSHSLRLHKEDSATTHRDCPGASCAGQKQAIMAAIHRRIVQSLA